MTGIARSLVRLAAIAAISLHASEIAAFAQDGSATPATVLPPPNGDVNKPGMNTANSFQLNAASASNQATLSLSDQSKQEGRNNWNWSLTLSSPIATGDATNGGTSSTNTKVATLDGLANGFQAKFKFGGFYVIADTVSNVPPAAQAIQDRAVAACQAKQPATTPPAKGNANPNSNAPPGPGNTNTNPCDPIKYQKGPGSFILDYTNRDSYDQYEMAITIPHAGLLAMDYGLQSAVGYNMFTFYNAKTLAKSTQNSEPWSAGLYVGVMPALGNYRQNPGMITLAANYQDVYKAKMSNTMCNSAASGISCATGSFGAPTHTEKYLLSINWAQQFQLPLPGKSYPVGIDPQVTYDAKSGVLGVDVPIYFIPDSNGALIAGLDVGWTADTHAFSIGLFVGVPFGLFKSGN
jgi:hypothetical protein